MSDWNVYRRCLPHWRSDDATYFVTWHLHRAQPSLTVIERDQLAGVLRKFDGERYKLFAYVIMNDHVHVLLEPRPAFPLQGIVHSWKSFSAWLLQRASRSGSIWQREYYDRIIRSESDFNEKLNYILGNPERRWPGIEGYPWVWCLQDALE